MSVVMRFGDVSPKLGAHLDTRIRAAIRRCLADEIERLLEMVDALDGDPDIEAGGDDEPGLGWIEFAGRGVSIFDERAPRDDRELDAGDEPDADAGDQREQDEDREPSLAFSIASSIKGAFPREERFEAFRRYRDELDFEGEPA